MPDEITNTTGVPASAPASEPAPAAPAPSAPVNPLLTPEPAPTPAPVGEPAQQPSQPALAAPATPPAPATPTTPAEPEVLDFGGRRVTIKPDDPMAKAWRAVYKDFQRQQATLTKTQQQLAQAQQPAPVAAPQAQPATQQTPPSSGTPSMQQMMAALTPEERQQFNERFMEDPVGAFEALTQRYLNPLVEQRVQPMQQQLKEYQEWQRQQVEQQRVLTELDAMRNDPTGAFADLDAMIPLMTQVAQMYPGRFDGPGGMELLYRATKSYMAGQTTSPAHQPVTLDTVKADQNLMNQILSDPAIEEQIVRRYLTGVANRTRPPITITASTPGGVAPVTPPTKPTDVRSAGQMWRATWGS